MPALRAVYARACQLTVIDVNAVTGHRCLHCSEGIGRNLVAKASAATVNHHAHLSGCVDAHLFRTESVEYFVNHLYFSVVVARSQCAQLRQAALFGAR